MTKRFSRCAVCNHAFKKKIEQAILDRRAPTVIAREFSVSVGSVKRHADEHIHETLAIIHETEERRVVIDMWKKELRTFDDLLTEANKIREMHYEEYARAQSNKDRRVALGILSLMGQNLDRLGRFAEESHLRDLAAFTNDQVEAVRTALDHLLALRDERLTAVVDILQQAVAGKTPAEVWQRRFRELYGITESEMPAPPSEVVNAEVVPSLPAPTEPPPPEPEPPTEEAPKSAPPTDQVKPVPSSEAEGRMRLISELAPVTDPTPRSLSERLALEQAHREGRRLEVGELSAITSVPGAATPTVDEAMAERTRREHELRMREASERLFGKRRT